MATYITDGTTTVYPEVVDGFGSDRESGTRVHPILGRSYPDVTYQPAGLRMGTFRLIFADELEAEAAELLHIAGNTLTIISTDRSTINFSYVVTGRVRRELDDQTRDVWIVNVDYQEVAA